MSRFIPCFILISFFIDVMSLPSFGLKAHCLSLRFRLVNCYPKTTQLYWIHLFGLQCKSYPEDIPSKRCKLLPCGTPLKWKKDYHRISYKSVGSHSTILAALFPFLVYDVLSNKDTILSLLYMSLKANSSMPTYLVTHLISHFSPVSSPWKCIAFFKINYDFVFNYWNT